MEAAAVYPSDSPSKLRLPHSRQVAVHEVDHPIDREVERVKPKLRQIDVIGAGFQRLYPQSLLNDVVVRCEYGQRRFQALEFFLDRITASGSKRRAGIRGKHMFHKSSVHVGEIVRRWAKCEAAPPSAQHMAALGCRPQRLLAVLFQLALLFLGRE